MEIKELQKQACEIIDAIDIKKGAERNAETIFLHLIEEIGEISRELVNPKLGRDKTNNENLKEEIIDILLLIFKLAKIYNLDLEQGVNNKIEKLKQKFDIK